MVVNIAVCDDEREFLDNINRELFQLANSLNIKTEIYLYTDGNKLVDLICNNKEEKERGACIIMATHNKSDVGFLCDKVLKMSDGRMEEVENDI